MQWRRAKGAGHSRSQLVVVWISSRVLAPVERRRGLPRRAASWRRGRFTRSGEAILMAGRLSCSMTERSGREKGVARGRRPAVRMAWIMRVTSSGESS
jgi:hypothetical protein